MAFFAVVFLSVVGGILAGDHFHSYMVGFSLATLAVGCCYWLSFRHTNYPQLALLMLCSGFAVKMGITVFGVMWSLERDLLTSPFVFALSYLFFSLVATYGYFKYREYVGKRIEAVKTSLQSS
ncbi:NADH:ubiquinone oxidoreductase [Enterovibrio norvegicus FF-33]|uniref:NADH:ubiquinone oxidoreductase n=1 Tax=Enterovibrio norvegicus FF-454 TaxID=1185651 RepID=A0A1E5C8B6_9GAMM|nr:hypothetical protein [Enterovibrio norvegicus]OEE61763.1 NADH:ubiquinone oxidoreductase [Enterovibrio norvegicus FF-454]OEE66560.1 NADH:ubiquinone oxidoreductase [Enterovibrio norvegicus FF-33]